jgi:hypothetical protein
MFVAVVAEECLVIFSGSGGGGGGSFGAFVNDISSSSSSSSEDPNLSTLVISCDIYEANYRCFEESYSSAIGMMALSGSHSAIEVHKLSPVAERKKRENGE